MAPGAAPRSRCSARSRRSASQCVDSVVVHAGRSADRPLVERARVFSGSGHARVLGAPSGPGADQRAADRADASAAARLQRRAHRHVRPQRDGCALSGVHAHETARRRRRRRPRVCLCAIQARAGAAHSGAGVVLVADLSCRASSSRPHVEHHLGDCCSGCMADAGAVVRILSVLPVGAARPVGALVRGRAVDREAILHRRRPFRGRRARAGAVPAGIPGDPARHLRLHTIRPGDSPLQRGRRGVPACKRRVARVGLGALRRSRGVGALPGAHHRRAGHTRNRAGPALWHI